MSDEVEVYESPRPVPEEGLRLLRDFAEAAGQAHELARLLVTTSFVPESYEGRADQAAAAILTGLSLGLDPMAALRSIDVIHGRPAIRALALRAIVQKAGHEIWVEESTATRAIVAARRRGSDKVERSTWTIERAQKLGVGGREQYRTQPATMLVARATAEVARLVAADALLGVPYTVEEMGDVVETTASVEAPKTTRKRKPLPAQTPPPPESSGEVVSEGEVPPVEDSEAEADLVAEALAEEARRSEDTERRGV